MRLDVFLAEQNKDLSRSRISDLIKRGFVLVDDKPVTKPGFSVLENHKVEIIKTDLLASRAGEKLEHALDAFQIPLRDLTIIDVGASTGGFTDLAIKSGAKHVYAYDVGRDQMVDYLKSHPQVSSFEETNILDVKVPENDLCLIDVSFTSVFPILKHLKNQTDTILFLLKPQFESEGQGLKKGILKDEKVLKRIMAKTTQTIIEIGFNVKGFTPSPIKGKDGNQEFLFLIQKGS